MGDHPQFEILEVTSLSQDIHSDVHLTASALHDGNMAGQYSITFHRPVWFEVLELEDGEAPISKSKRKVLLKSPIGDFQNAFHVPNDKVVSNLSRIPGVVSKSSKPFLQLWEIGTRNGQLLRFLVSEQPTVSEFENAH